jgi:hypothetical protein
MRSRTRQTVGECSLAATALALAAFGCGSSSEPEQATAVRTVTCTAESTKACTCSNGQSGTQRCQLDGSYSLCACGATSGVSATAGSIAAAPVITPPPLTPAGNNPARPPAGMGAAPAPAMPPPVDVKPIIVPPEDVAACNGMGTAPTADEAVEVIKIRTSDVVPGGFKAPGGTLYGCFWVEIDMPEKHHIIGWEGAVGGDRAIHHQQVSLGKKPFYLSQQGGLCGLPSVEYTWTGERPPEWTPSLAGYPIGGPEQGGKARFLFQVHFESATTYSGGFNAYVTKKLRKYDAGNFEQGDVAGINIPPKAAITHEAKCTSEMTTQKLNQPIYVFASMLHAHLTVKHIKSEQFRGGKLVTTFGDQMTAGFAGFFDQSFHPQTPCVEVLPGDELLTTCDYQNPWDQPVMGGEATNQEMCTTFMQYFPRLPNASDNFCGTIDSSGGFTGK